ncbi:arylsulfatase B-like [Mya arenaria]|uniref:arylsulfatase B-like n=1 Tax=Mya arenaria TaxID=6604 RepID=UPI0022E98428|nr:arylsulfatase B-like [Mya arenaria]XP_052819436.1 arylsulfatase B-like [Mya arenaria]XP_052819437.1 arylsulfatase B-like [Mya arenaria]XP_052819439.1 arylsulfatase B-like [Mya arenaria]XP_052819440.1 arylsulfatase B-like [Mya arenaria]XP_052819441.1 arylsulfatase B-like [Mya arenaria]XP_052819442.1 arylsulfatase B-like [Mya arenaria]
MGVPPWWLAALETCLMCTAVTVMGMPPNIVFIVADDLGWNDVGYHNPDVITPNIDKLANMGVKLNQSYVQPVCSPSRHAFMTGYYPWKAGLQHMVIWDQQDVCSPLNLKFLPEKLKEAGYATHAIGKWHLGFCSWNCTPMYRGFDSFYGYYNSRSDYYTHHEANFLDFHDGYEVVWDKNESYSAHLYAERAERIILEHDTSKPLFMYLPYQNTHEPLQVPPEYEALYPNVKTPDRKTFCGMATALDAAIGRVVSALEKKGLYEDTMFFFTPDNGGWPAKGGNNWPLRGSKITIWEGGTRVPAFVSGSRLKKSHYSFNGLFHAVDWNPTIVSAAGLKPDPGMDGIDQWEAINTGEEGQRTEFIYNLDDVVPATQGHAGIRVGDYKLLEGLVGAYNGWYPPDQVYTEDSMHQWEPHTVNQSYYKLYNLKDDPNEYHNLADDMPSLVKEMAARMKEYHRQMIPAKNPPANPAGNPKYYGNVWSPGWCKQPMT